MQSDFALFIWCEAILKGASLSIRATKEMARRELDEPGLTAAMSRRENYPAFSI